MHINSNIFLPNFQLFPYQQFLIEMPNQNINTMNHQENNNYIFPHNFQPLILGNNISNIKEEANDNNENNQKNIFIVNKYNKRGKVPYKANKNKRYIHEADSFDNLERKIQVHFLTFLINFCNDALKTEYVHSNCTFKQIKYRYKSDIRQSYINLLKHWNIKDILNLEISSKFRAFNRYENRNLLNKILSSDWLDKLFQMSLTKLFNYYYNKEKPVNKIIFENKEIILSSKTKSFYFLLRKYKDLREKLIDTAKFVYLNDTNEF